MPIDIKNERLLKLSAVPSWLLARGRAVGLRNVYEWAESGKLETTVRLNQLFTSIEALQRMAEGERAVVDQQQHAKPIDIERERLMKLSEVPAWLLERGVRVSLRRVFAWAEQGKLGTVKIGVRCTSIEAIQRMADSENTPPPPVKQKQKRTNKKITEAAREAMRQAEAEGW